VERASARFAAAGELGVRDARADLIWAARDSDAELDWQAAERHCGERPPAGTWRLASSDELASLYDADATQACGDANCRVDPAIDLTSPYQWSATARGERRRVYLDLRYGTRLAPLLRPELTRRALCVRTASAP